MLFLGEERGRIIKMMEVEKNVIIICNIPSLKPFKVKDT
jgi:hypothetical protein